MKATFTLPKTKAGRILAFVDVELLDGVIVKGFRVHRKDEGIAAAVPMRSFLVGGQTRWMNQVVFESPEVRDRFLASIVKKFQKWERNRETNAKGGRRRNSRKQ